MHDLPMIATLTGALAVALVFGWATQRIGLSTLVGYMLAGIVVGPYTPGFVADTRLAAQMAEIGVDERRIVAGATRRALTAGHLHGIGAHA